MNNMQIEGRFELAKGAFSHFVSELYFKDSGRFDKMAERIKLHYPQLAKDIHLAHSFYLDINPIVELSEIIDVEPELMEKTEKRIDETIKKYAYLLQTEGITLTKEIVEREIVLERVKKISLEQDPKTETYFRTALQTVILESFNEETLNESKFVFGFDFGGFWNVLYIEEDGFYVLSPIKEEYKTDNIQSLSNIKTDSGEVVDPIQVIREAPYGSSIGLFDSIDELAKWALENVMDLKVTGSAYKGIFTYRR